MNENTKQERVYGKYTVRSKHRKGQNDENLMSGVICITTEEGELKRIGHFVYTCSLGLVLDDRDDFETFKECAEVMTEYLKETLTK